jgi:hypothetical protein
MVAHVMGDRSLRQDEKADERHYATSKPLQKSTTSHRRAISFTDRDPWAALPQGSGRLWSDRKGRFDQ